MGSTIGRRDARGLFRRAQEKGLAGNISRRVGKEIANEADDFFFFRQPVE